MDIATHQGNMKDLFQKARAARKAGNRKVAASFRAGARRLQREIKAELIRTGQRKKKKKEE